MREYHFEPEGELPVVRVALSGPHAQKLVTLVFDTGCSLTQIHQPILTMIGCGEETAITKVTLGGVKGEGDCGYIVALNRLALFERNFTAAQVAAVDFSKWAAVGIEGLLGWDLIRLFYFELNGPAGILKVF